MRWTTVVALVALVGAAAWAADGKERAFKFSKDDVGKVPAGWKAEQTGKGEGSVWKVVADDTAPSKGGYALAQTAKSPGGVFNILDNGIKYTAEGGEVEVRTDRQGPEAVVIVRDTGVGIPEEHLPRVFDRFYRVDRARSRSEGGTGLGLSIAQSIAAAHGGRIELASTPGRGTTCTVRLPADTGP